MNEVKVNKAELKAIVLKNRDEHRDIFLKAQAAYRVLVVEELDRQLREARDAAKIPRWERLTKMPVPQDHTTDYDRVLLMLNMSVDDHIVLEASDFARYVQDDWEWSRSWAISNSSYTSSPKFSKYTDKSG